jgi:hypothetical protein
MMSYTVKVTVVITAASEEEACDRVQSAVEDDTDILYIESYVDDVSGFCDCGKSADTEVTTGKLTDYYCADCFKKKVFSAKSLT